MRNNKDAVLSLHIAPEETAVPCLGEPRFDTTKQSGAFMPDDAGVLVGISKSSLTDEDASPVFFEEAGPPVRACFSIRATPSWPSSPAAASARASTTSSGP